MWTLEQGLEMERERKMGEEMEMVLEEQVEEELD